MKLNVKGWNWIQKLIKKRSKTIYIYIAIKRRMTKFDTKTK
jgi:hypothetical protein